MAFRFAARAYAFQLNGGREPAEPDCGSRLVQRLYGALVIHLGNPAACPADQQLHGIAVPARIGAGDEGVQALDAVNQLSGRGAEARPSRRRPLAYDTPHSVDIGHPLVRMDVGEALVTAGLEGRLMSGVAGQPSLN